VKFKEFGKTKEGKQGFIGDAPKLWKKAPNSIKMTTTLCMAKNETRLHCKNCQFKK
jgi:hypothetical protein